MKNRANKFGIFMRAAVMAALVMSSGCGGGGGGSAAAPAANAPVKSATGYGKVAAVVKLTPPAGRAAGQVSSATVTVSISISGVYSADDKEFKPVTTSSVIDIAAGPAKVSMLNVPIGVNHLITVVADWGGGSSETLKAIIPKVSDGELATTTVDPVSTAVAAAALYIAEKDGKRLADLDEKDIAKIEETVSSMAANGVSYFSMTPAQVFSYMAAAGIPSAVELTPATATLVAGGTLQFSALVNDANGVLVSGAAASWSFSNSAAGSIGSTGLFTGTASGTGVVTASYAGLTATASVTVVSVCANDAACNDNNALTIDTCSAPGTLSAQCAHATIACAVDSDCNDNNSATLDTCAGGGAIGAECAHTTIVNLPPAASATASVSSGVSPLSVNFTGGCADSDGTCASYLWNFGDGATSALQNPSHVYTATGTFTATLIVTDNQGATGQNTAIISVAGNQAPVGTIGADLTTGIYPLNVNFTGGCADPDGTCVSYLWDFGDGSPTNSSQSPSHSFNATGTFTVTVTVTDNLGATNQQTITITTTAVNQPPAATSLSAIPNGGAAPLDVAFAATCYDPDGTCVSYAWDFGDGATSSVQNPGHTYTAAGTFNVSLTVMDNSGGTATSGVAVTVSPANVPPTASASSDVSGGVAPMTVNFTGGCVDSDGTCISYAWNFGDGSATSATQSPSHIYTAAGTYSALLIVTDDLGATAQSVVIITVSGNQAPIGSISSDFATGPVPLFVNFTGGCTDGDGACVSYLWDFGDGSPSDSSQNPSHNFSAAGIYTVTLTVTDNYGATAQSSLVITVDGACGNSVVEPGESCDDGNTVTDSCLYGEMSCMVCDSACQNSPGAVVGYCGDSAVQPGDGEMCDDGNIDTESCAYGDVSCTVCDGTCQSVSGAVIGYCGDGGVQPGDGETCDDGNIDTESCAYGDVSCTVCDGTCQSVSGAVIGYCGDGGVQPGDGETCDDGNNVTENCMYGDVSCTVCDSACQDTQGVAVGYCGDGAVQAGEGETCDDGNIDTESCAYGDMSCMVCDGACQDSPGAVVGYCGDNAVQAGDGETCDDGNMTPGDGCDATCAVEAGVSAGDVSAGEGHTCAVYDAGGVKCWGDNNFGQLGDGTTFQSSYPVTVTGITAAAKVAAGFTHSCAVLTDGTIQCWGDNSYGQLGDGTTNQSSTPVTVSGITTATAVTTGSMHTCALLLDGSVKCWGENIFGQLGDGTTASSLIPVTVTGLGLADAIAAGAGHSCALVAGTAQCWGDNSYGQLGDGTNTPSSYPVGATGIVSATALGMGISANSSCALLSDGTAMCWGDNMYGQLGNGTTTPSSTPVAVGGLSNAIQVSIGQISTCALLTDGTLMCWGADGEGEFGNGTMSDSHTPVAAATGISTTMKISTGFGQSCALLSNSSLKCWGYNSYGKVGDGTMTDKLTPVVVTGFGGGF